MPVSFSLDAIELNYPNSRTGIEGDVDAGVPHLVSDIRRRLAIGDQLTREEMAIGLNRCAVFA